MKIDLIPKLVSEQLSDDNKNVLGGDLFKEPFANIFLCARKKSGKTTVLYNILKNCAGKRTKVVCFASTVFKDVQWLRIADILKKKNISFEGHMSMHDELTGRNILTDLMTRLQKEAKQNVELEIVKKAEMERKLQNKKQKKKRTSRKTKTRINGIQIYDDLEKRLSTALHSSSKRKKLNASAIMQSTLQLDVSNSGKVLFEDDNQVGLFEKEMAMAFGGNKSNRLDQDLDIVEINEQKKKAEDDGFVTPEWIFIFDDLSNELRNPHIAHLLKTNRHYKAKVIISSQYVQDIPPSSRKQIDYWLLFGGHSVDKLEVIFYDADTRLSLEQFINLYRKVTAVPYQFLTLNTTEDTYRAGFSKLLRITPSESGRKIEKVDADTSDEYYND